MSLDKIVEEAIRKAQERGEFDNLPGKGKPIDLSAYFETPEEVRVAQSVLKNSGFTSMEVSLLNEIAELKKLLAVTTEEKKRETLQKQLRDRQIEFNLRLERLKKK